MKYFNIIDLKDINNSINSEKDAGDAFFNKIIRDYKNATIGVQIFVPKPLDTEYISCNALKGIETGKFSTKYFDNGVCIGISNFHLTFQSLPTKHQNIIIAYIKGYNIKEIAYYNNTLKHIVVRVVKDIVSAIY